MILMLEMNFCRCKQRKKIHKN